MTNKTNSDKTINKLKKFVVESAEKSSEREVKADKAERDVDDYYKARYIKPLAGYSGTCIDDELYYAIMDNKLVEDLPNLESYLLYFPPISPIVSKSHVTTTSSAFVFCTLSLLIV